MKYIYLANDALANGIWTVFKVLFIIALVLFLMKVIDWIIKAVKIRKTAKLIKEVKRSIEPKKKGSRK
jgi:hypothetical protein